MCSPDRHVLVQQPAVLGAAGEPAAVPGAIDADAQADGIDFVTHHSRSSAAAGFSRTTTVICGERLQDAGAATAAAGMEALHHHVLADPRLADDEIVDVELMVVLGVGDGAHQALPDVAGDALPARTRARRAPCSTFLPRIIAATRLSFCGDTRRFRATACASVSGRLRCVLRLAHVTSSPLSCRRRGRGRCGSARTRRTCARPCPR